MDLLLTGQTRTVPEPMDVDQFMAFLETRPNGEHWELIEGVAVMMAPASIAHQLIASNFCSLLNTALRANGIPLFACSNIGLRNPGLRTFQPEPDVVVLPGVAGYELYAEEFYLAGEILSPSNTKREIDTKLRALFRRAQKSLRGRDRSAQNFGANLCQEPRLGSRHFEPRPRPDRDAGIRPELSR